MVKGKRTRRMVVENNEIAFTIFSDEELRKMRGFGVGEGYVKVDCGCSSRKLGDFDGELRIASSGQFLIDCKCTTKCEMESNNLTPDAFERHCHGEAAKKWQKNIWVSIDDEKVPIKKTALLKYYRHTANEANNLSIARRRRNFHGNEFITCSNPECQKQRMFVLRTEEQFREYHKALYNKEWTCTDHSKGMTCTDRESQKGYRGCPRSSTCNGCMKCVCFGCFRCRFMDCGCRDCVQYINNAPPEAGQDQMRIV